MKRRSGYNPKRALCLESGLTTGQGLAGRVGYGGNPEHKRTPGDFGLTPPADPRPGKALCDDSGVCSKAEAMELVRRGLLKGTVSAQRRNGWPQNVWAVADDGRVFEAQLENEVLGTYHGYPMLDDDPFLPEVVAAWGEQ